MLMRGEEVRREQWGSKRGLAKSWSPKRDLRAQREKKRAPQRKISSAKFRLGWVRTLDVVGFSERAKRMETRFDL